MAFLPGGDIISQIIYAASIMLFVVFMLYRQRIQMYVMIREVEASLYKLKFIKEEGRKIAIETIKEIGKPQTDPIPRVDRYLEYFTISFAEKIHNFLSTGTPSETIPDQDYLPNQDPLLRFPRPAIRAATECSCISLGRVCGKDGRRTGS